jgi:hypothetical protein
MKSNTNEKAQSAEEILKSFMAECDTYYADSNGNGYVDASNHSVLKAMENYAQSSISQLETDLAKSQERIAQLEAKCQRYEEAFNRINNMKSDNSRSTGNRFLIATELSEQALKTTRDEQI